MTIYFEVVFGLYFLLLVILWLGWRKVIAAEANAAAKNKFISVVIAMRNEEANLHKLFQSLLTQTYQAKDFEIIIVDDHSADQSIAVAKEWIDSFSSLTVLSQNEIQKGKKAALTYGISQAKGEVVAFTDADCVVSASWLQRINEGFQDEAVNMLIGAVALDRRNSFFSRLQSIEFGSVIGTGLAMAAFRKPIMCNGANLSFRKKLFDEVNGYTGNERVASGDDEFLMRKILNKYPHSVRVLNFNDSVVVTKPQASVKDFIQQRLRWASKWKWNTSLSARLLAVLMLLVQITWLWLIVWIFIHDNINAIVIVASKVMLDLVFLSSVCRSLKMRFNLLAFTCLQFLYPLYVCSIGIFSQLINHEWKGRQSRDVIRKSKSV